MGNGLRFVRVAGPAATIGLPKGSLRALAAWVGVLVLGLAAPAGARTWGVPAGVPTIQAGIDSAATGDTVLVAPGTYVGSGNRDIHFRGRDVVVRSEGGADVTVVDVQASPSDPHRGFFIGTQEGPGAVLDGFTIVNGYMGAIPGRAPAAPTKAGLPRVRHDLSAGGIKCQDAAPTLRNLVIERCGSEFTGGGMSIELLASPTVENCVFRGCFADYGGGLSIETVSSPTVTDCVVTGNRARRGGGLFLQALGTIEGCVVSGNRAIELGGGALVINPASPTLQRTIVWGNCAGTGGDEFSIDQDVTLTFGCGVIDSTGVFRAGVTSIVIWQGENVFTAPHFCYPLPCTSAPATGGDYRLQAESPGLPARSPCGQRIGPLDQGCVAQTTVSQTTWSRLKTGYR
jgi:Right handed beta helix region